MRRAIFACALALCAACGQYGPLVTITLEGEGRAGLSGVATEVTLDGKPGQPLDFPGVTDRFALRLPVGATGQLDVDVFGEMDGEPCLPAWGRGGVALAGEHEASLTVRLDRMQFRPCEDQPAAILAVHGRSERDVWMVGAKGLVLRWDGVMLQRITTGVSADLNAVWAGPDEVWIVGGKGTVLTGSASTLSSARSLRDQTDLYAVHGGPDGRVWIGGAGGLAYRLEGGSFTPHSVESGFTVRSIWALGPDDAYAATGRGDGSGGRLLHYVGVKDGWDLMASTTSPLFGVWAGSRDDVWAVGDKGVLVHNLDQVPGGAGLALTRIAAASADAVFAVGKQGALLRLRAGGVQRMEPPEAYRAASFLGAWTPAGKESLWIGGEQPGAAQQPGRLVRYVP